MVYKSVLLFWPGYLPYTNRVNRLVFEGGRTYQMFVFLSNILFISIASFRWRTVDCFSFLLARNVTYNICLFLYLFFFHCFKTIFLCTIFAAAAVSRQSLETAIYPRPHRQQYPFILTPNRAQKFVFRPFSSNFALAFSQCLLFLVRFLPIKIGRLRTVAERK